MLKFSKLFLHQQKASVSIEFAIIFPLLIMLFLFALELSRIMFIGSALNLMTAEITRKVAISEGHGVNYSQQLEQFIEEEVPLWPYLTNSDSFQTTVTYCTTIQDVINDNCHDVSDTSTHIILFKLEYDYYAMFSSMFGRILDSSLKKKTIVYREFY